MDDIRFLDVPSGNNPRARMERTEKRIELFEKRAQDIRKEIESVNKKHFEQKVTLLQSKRDSEASKQIEKELSALKQRRDFLKSPLMLERCNEAIAKNKQHLEWLKNSQAIEDEWRMDFV